MKGGPASVKVSAVVDDDDESAEMAFGGLIEGTVTAWLQLLVEEVDAEPTLG